jgi:hypothetical protein
MFATISILYVTHSPQTVTKLALLGYPLYVLGILGTAKMLGAIALARIIREWEEIGRQKKPPLLQTC